MEGASFMILACENVVQTYSLMGIPHNESTVGWDIPTDPLIAARYFTERTMSRRTTVGGRIRCILPHAQYVSQAGATDLADLRGSGSA